MTTMAPVGDEGGGSASTNPGGDGGSSGGGGGGGGEGVEGTTGTTAPTMTTTTSSTSVTTGPELAPAGPATPQQHPPPSPLSGCYLLVVLPEPHTAQHKDLILNRLAKGFLSWDKDSCHVDLEKELQALVAQAPEGEEARNGERLIQYATENLVTEVLIYPQSNTLLQCIRNLLASFTKHRHIIHAGYTFGGNGSWILQDGTFSVADFLDAFSEHEVQRVLRAYENSVTVDIHCAGVGDWSTYRLSREVCTKTCRVRVNPDDVLTAGVPAITSFTNYIGQYLITQTLDQLMEPSDVVGNIRFSHPTLYVFPGGQGDAALFGINGFNMLVDGGFARKACFWDFARHLDRLDAVLVTRINNSNVGGMSSVLRKKKEMHVYPQIGHFFCNLVERRHSNSPDGDKDIDPLILNLIDIGQEMTVNLRHINLRPHPCYRDPEPINLYHKVGHGTLDMYVLSPSKDSREVREFMAKWNSSDSKLFAGVHRKDSNSITFPIQSLVSICAMLVWQPANPEDTITRILFPGSTPQHKIFEGFERLKHLEFLKRPVCTVKSLSPSSSLVALKDKTTISKPKLSSIERETKRLAEIKKEKRDIADLRNIKKELIADNNTKISTGKPIAPSQPKAEIKAKKVVENKKIESETKENKKIEKELKETKREIKKIEKSDRLDMETKKTDAAKIETEKTALAKDSKMQKIEKKKENKDLSTKMITKPAKPESTIKQSLKPVEKKPKLSGEKKDIKSSPTTPKKTLNGSATKTETAKTVVKSISKITSKITSATPAKSAKDANNRMVVEQKNIELTQASSAVAAASKAALKSKTSERKIINRRTKAMSPSKVRLPISPAKSTRSTPTASVKSDKDAVIRKVKGGTTDSSAVSTPSGIEPESAVKLIDKNLIEKSEDMSLDSIESKVLADLKEEREVVEEIEAVLQKAERIEEARKEERFEGDDEITAEAMDKKDEDFTEEDITAEMDDAPKKISRKESQELTEEDEYLIVEKEEIYTEDSVQSGDAEHKHHLDEAESEKTRINIEQSAEVEESEHEEDEDKDFAEEKKDEVPEKLLVESTVEQEKKNSLDLSPEQKEQLKEEVEQVIGMAMETVKKIEEKDDSGKKDSEDITKEPSSLSPEKLDFLSKPDVAEQKEQVLEKMEESQERISTLESGATTTAPTMPEDERIPLDEIKEDVDEKHVMEEIKEKDVAIKQKDVAIENFPVTSKPEVKELLVKAPTQHGIPRDVVKTPDEVADLPMHEEVDPKLYRMYDQEKDVKVSAPIQEIKEQITPPAKEQNNKGVLGFFGKVADKFEKGIDKLTKKARRDSDVEDKSSKSSSPKEFKLQEQKAFEKEIKEFKVKNVEQSIPTVLREVKNIEEPQIKLKDNMVKDIEEIESLIEETSTKLKDVKDSLQDSLESLEEKVNKKNKLVISSKDEVEVSLTEAADKLVDITHDIIDTKESEKVTFIISSNDDIDEGDDNSNDEIIRDFKEAVRDVAEVLVGTAGIEIEKGKPKDVEEIVKKVAEVLKEDDFLPKDKSDVKDIAVEEPCIKIVNETEITVLSPSKDIITDKDEVFKICDDIMKTDIIRHGDVKKSEISLKTESKIDVMVSGVEDMCVKETVKRDIYDEKLDEETIVVESEIGFDQKLSPGKAELVTVTSGSTPTSPKLATEIKLPEFPSDYEAILNEDSSLESIMEKFIVTKKYKITMQVLEYLSVAKNVPKEKIIIIIQEIISKFSIWRESVFDTSLLTVFETYTMTIEDDKTDKSTVKRESIHLEEQINDGFNKISSTDIIKDLEIEKTLPDESKSVDDFEAVEQEHKVDSVVDTYTDKLSILKDKKSVEVSENASTIIEYNENLIQKVDKSDIREKNPENLLQESDQDVEISEKSEGDTKEKYLDEAKEKIVSEMIDLEIKTQDLLQSGDISPAESVFLKSPTINVGIIKEGKSKSSSVEKEMSEKEESPVIFEKKVHIKADSDLRKSPSAEEVKKEIVSEKKTEEKSKSSSVKKETEKKEELLDRSKSPVDEKVSMKDEKSKSPTPEKDNENKEKAPEILSTTADQITEHIATLDIKIEKSRFSTPEKDLKERTPELLEDTVKADIKADKSKSPSAEKDEVKTSSDESISSEGKVNEYISIHEKSKSPTPEKEHVKEKTPESVEEAEKLDIKDDKLKSPSVEKEIEKTEDLRKTSVISIEIEKTNAEKSKSASPEKEIDKKEKTFEVIEEAVKTDTKDKKSKSPSMEKDFVKKDSTPDKPSSSEETGDKAIVKEDEVKKPKSPTPEKVETPKPHADTLIPEITEPLRDKPINSANKLNNDVTKADFGVKTSKSPTPEKEEKQESAEATVTSEVEDDKSKSPSVEKDEVKNESSPDKLVSSEDVIGEQVTISDVKEEKSPTPEKEEKLEPTEATATSDIKDDKSKSPSVEKDEVKKESSPDKLVSSDDVIGEQVAISDVKVEKSPTPVKEEKLESVEATVTTDIKDDKSKSPSVEKDEVKKESSPDKLVSSDDVIGEQVAIFDVKVEKSPTPEKVFDEKEEKLESAEATVTSVVEDDKSKSPSVEKDEVKKESSPDKLVSSEDVIGEQVTISDVKVEKSPTPEKEEKLEPAEATATSDIKNDKSKSPSVEKDEVKKESSPDKLVSSEDVIGEQVAISDVKVEKSPTPEKEEKLEPAEATATSDIKNDKSKSPSVEKDEVKKESSPDKLVSSDDVIGELVAMSDVKKEKSPTPEKEEKPESAEATVTSDIKDDKSKSPSVEKDEVKKESSPDKLVSSEDVVGEQVTISDVKVEKSPTPEKEEKPESAEATVTSDIKDDKSKSPSVEKDEVEKEPSPDKSVSSEDVIGEQVAIFDVKVEKSPTPEKVLDEKEEKPELAEATMTSEVEDDKSKSPSVEKDEVKKESSPVKLVSSEDVIGELVAISDVKVEKSPTPEKEEKLEPAEATAPSDIKDDKSKSPSVEKDEVKKESSSDKLVSSDDVIGEQVAISDLKEEKSPTPEKGDKPESAEATVTSDIKDDKSKSPSVEKDEVKKESSSDKLVSSDDVIGEQVAISDVKVEKSPTLEKDFDGNDKTVKLAEDIEKLYIKDDKLQSLSIEKEIEKTEDLRKASVIFVECLKADSENLNTTSPEEEIDKKEESKLPSIEKDIVENESSPDKIVASGIKYKTSSPEKDEDNKEPTLDKSIGFEDKLGDDFVKADVKVEKTNSLTLENEADESEKTSDVHDNVNSNVADNKSKSPSLEKETEKGEDIYNASVISASPEKEIEKKGKTPENEEALKLDAIDIKSLRLENDVAEKESSADKPLGSADEVAEHVTSDENIEKPPTPEQEIDEKEKTTEPTAATVESNIENDKPKSLSIEKDEIIKKQLHAELVTFEDKIGEQVATSDEKVKKSKSPSPEKEDVTEKTPVSAEVTEKLDIKDDECKSPSVEKEVEKADDIRKDSIISVKNLQIDVVKSKSASPEKEIDEKEKTFKIIEEALKTDVKDEKSKSPSIEKDFTGSEPSPDKVISKPDEKSKLLEKAIDEREKTPESDEATVALNLKDDKSKSISIDKETEKTVDSRKVSIIFMDSVQVDGMKSKLTSPEKETEKKEKTTEIVEEVVKSDVKDDKSKSPSMEKDVAEKEPIPDKSISFDEKVDEATVVFGINMEKSKSPTPEKEKTLQVAKDTSKLGTKENELKSSSVEREIDEKKKSLDVTVSQDKVSIDVTTDVKSNKSKSPIPAKEVDEKEKSPEKYIICEDKMTANIEKICIKDERSSSTCMEKEVFTKESNIQEITEKLIEFEIERDMIELEDIINRSKSPSAETENKESSKISIISTENVTVISEKSNITDKKSKFSSPEKETEKQKDFICSIAESLVLDTKDDKSPSTENVITKEVSPEKSTISKEKIDTDKLVDLNISKSPSAEKEGDSEILISFDDNIKVICTKSTQKKDSVSPSYIEEKVKKLIPGSRSSSISEPNQHVEDRSRTSSISGDLTTEKTQADALPQDFVDDRKTSMTSIGSHLEEKGRSRSHSLFDTEGDIVDILPVKSRSASLYGEKILEKLENIESTKDLSKHVETISEEKEEINIFTNKYNYKTEESSKEEPLSPKTIKTIQDYIVNEYVNKKRIVTLEVINELSSTYKIDRHIVMKIVNEIIANFNTNRETILGFNEEDIEDSTEKILEDEEKLKNYINDVFISKKKKINSTIVDEIAHANSVSRHLVILVIENIISSQNLQRESVVDVDFNVHLDPLEEELLKEKALREEAYVIHQKLFEFSSKDSESDRSQAKEGVSHSEYESQFHKAFIGGMTEIKTTHITTLSGKSTPESGLRDDTSADSTFENLNSTTTTITNVPGKFEETSVEQTSEKSLMQTDDLHDVIRTDNVKITKTTQIIAQPIESKEIITESIKRDDVSSKLPSERKVSIEGKYIPSGHDILQDIEEQIEHSTSSIVKELISESHSRKSSTSVVTVASKDIAYGGSTEKSIPEISMSPLIRDGNIIQSHLSGRSTPDKRSSDNRSRTATPEGFRSGDVIRTIITTTRTVSDDGEIIITTQEVTEATNEKGETIVLAEKTDVKVDERLPEGIITDVKSIDPQRASSPSSDLADKEIDPTSPRSDLSSGHSRAATHVWGSSEERHTYSDEEPTSPPLSSSPHCPPAVESGKGESTRGDFSGATMTSSFYDELPSETIHYSSSIRKSPETLSEQEDFKFRKFTVEKEYTGTQADKGSKKYVDKADLDFDKALEASGFTHELQKSEQSKSDSGSSKPAGGKEDPLCDWGSPLGLPSPKAPRKFNLRSPIQPCSSADLSPDSLNFDVINDWGEPMRLPSPAPTSNEISNKASPSTPKKDKKQAKKVMSENIKNKKRSESPVKNEKRIKDSKNKVQPIYVDLTYVSHHGNSFYTALEFFKKVRARYYVFSGTEPSREVYDALLEAKKTWEDKDLEVTMIPTYDTESLGYWVADNEEALAAHHIDLSPSASRCTINLQDHETSCSAYRLEF